MLHSVMENALSLMAETNKQQIVGSVIVDGRPGVVAVQCWSSGCMALERL